MHGCLFLSNQAIATARSLCEVASVTLVRRDITDWLKTTLRGALVRKLLPLQRFSGLELIPSWNPIFQIGTRVPQLSWFLHRSWDGYSLNNFASNTQHQTFGAEDLGYAKEYVWLTQRNFLAACSCHLNGTKGRSRVCQRVSVPNRKYILNQFRKLEMRYLRSTIFYIIGIFVFLSNVPK